MPLSFVSHLECSGCGKRCEIDALRNVCPDCTRSLLVRYDLVAARRTLQGGTWPALPGMWKYAPLMPARSEAEIVTLGEGATPLLEVPVLAKRLGVKRVWIKEEAGNPTASFKARGMSAAITMAKALGAKRVCVPTAGNAGGACAAYCARAGLACNVYVPKDAPAANRLEVRLAGANVVEVDGTIADAAARMRAEMAHTPMFDVSTLKEPYRAEGKKTMGFEIVEALGGRVPTAILYPAGGGTGIIGMWKAFDELEAVGLLGSQRPRMFAIQAAGCAPLVKSMREGKPDCEPWKDAATIASGLRVPKAYADRLILDILRRSAGDAVAVTDAELKAAVGELFASTGVFFCPEGAACWPAAQRLGFGPDDEVVIFNTGSGYKYLDCL